MPGLSRRTFLRNGSLTVMAAGVASAVPGLSTLASTAGADAPALDSVAAPLVDNPELESQLVAHVRDLGTGEISVFHGTQEYIIHDPAVARSLFRASR